MKWELSGLPNLPDIQNRLREACHEWYWKKFYKDYTWGIDIYDSEYPFIRILEKVISQALRTRSLNVGHLLAVKLWGARNNRILGSLRRNVAITNAVDICKSLFQEEGRINEDVRNSPEKPISLVQENCSGFGPTFSSKLLRFALPEEYAAIDTRIARYFGPHGLNWLPQIQLKKTPRGYYIDRDRGWPISYKHWINILRFLAECLNNERQLKCPYPETFISEGLRPRNRIWYVADIEMTLFVIASHSQGKEATFQTNTRQTQPRPGEYAGICPRCGSPLKWRRARKTGELYRGCTNFEDGCRWNDRSY